VTVKKDDRKGDRLYEQDNLLLTCRQGSATSLVHSSTADTTRDQNTASIHARQLKEFFMVNLG